MEHAHIRRRIASVGALAAAAVLAVVMPAAARAADPLPVQWDAASLTTGGSTPDTVPGANDWSCRPSAGHPRPVVLVHGLGATLGANWHTMSPLLANNGFCVFGLTYGRRDGNPYTGGLTRMEDSSQELKAFVDRVLRETGATQVDLVGHSEGTVMPRWYLSFLGGAAKVKRYIQFTPLWQGTNLLLSGDLLGLAKQNGSEPSVDATFAAGGCGSCPEFPRGSSYLDQVNAAGPAVKGVEYTEVVTQYDELVIPYTSGILDAPNVKNVVLQDVCATDYSEHAAVAYDPIAGQVMLNALDPARARPLPCTLVLPSGTPNPPFVGLGPDKARTSAADPGARSCAKGDRLTIKLPRRRGERILRVTATSAGKRVASRRGRSLRSLEINGLAPGPQTIRLRIRSARGTRTVTLRRTVRCAGSR